MIANSISRYQLIAWAQSITNADIKKIQSLGDGIVICQILNNIFPNVVQMNKINTKAKTNFDKQKNIGLFFNAVFKLQLPPLHVKYVDLVIGKTAAIMDTLKWLNKRQEEKKLVDSKGNIQEERKKIKSYLGELVTRKKAQFIEKDKQSKSVIEKSDKRRSQTCQPKNRQTSQIFKIVKSNKPRQSKLKLFQEGLLRQDNLQQNDNTVQKSQTKKCLKNICLSQPKIPILSKDRIPKQINFKKQNIQKTVQQVLNEVIRLDPQIIKSKLIKITNFLSEQKIETKNKIKQILSEGCKKNQQISLKEQMQSLHQSKASQILFSLDNNTEYGQRDTIQFLQFQQNQNMVKIQISPRFRNENDKLNQNSKENMQKNSNSYLTQKEKNKKFQKSSMKKNILQKNLYTNNLNVHEQLQKNVMMRISGKKEKKVDKQQASKQVIMCSKQIMYPDLNPQVNFQNENLNDQTSVLKYQQNLNLQI